MTQHVFGMDISRHQYDPNLEHKFDFVKAYKAGIRFCACRATVGDYYTDTTLDRNVKGAQDAGIVPLVYHVPAYHDGSFSQLRIKPANAIDRFLNAVAKYGIDDEAHVLDCEIIRGGNARSGSQYHQEGVELLKHIKGFTWYTNKNIGDNVMIGFSSFWRKHFGWVANYTTAGEPYIPKWADTWHCWQYTSTARGTDYGAWSKSIDLNRMKQEMWLAITNQAAPPPSTPPLPQPATIQASITIDGNVYSGELKRKDS